MPSNALHPAALAAADELSQREGEWLESAYPDLEFTINYGVIAVIIGQQHPRMSGGDRRKEAALIYLLNGGYEYVDGVWSGGDGATKEREECAELLEAEAEYWRIKDDPSRRDALLAASRNIRRRK